MPRNFMYPHLWMVRLSKGQDAYLRAEAKRTRRSVSQLLRDMIDNERFYDGPLEGPEGEP